MFIIYVSFKHNMFISRNNYTNEKYCWDNGTDFEKRIILSEGSRGDA